MAHVVEASGREIIRIPLGALELPSTLPAVPLVVQDGSSFSMPCDDDSSLKATLLRLDRRSLFTGSTTDLEVAFLIPPNEDPSKNARVEEVCNRLGLGGNDGSFRTDGLMNAFLLESSLRVHLDSATFLITLPFIEFCSLSDQLRLDNEEWIERAKHDATAKRILGSHQPRLYSYEIGHLAFYEPSSAFLPGDTTIEILPNECRTLERPCPNAPSVAKKPQIYDELICEFPYPPSLRENKDKLSPLALLVNAHYKLKAYMARVPRRHRCFPLEQYFKFTSRFLDMLYFVPSQEPKATSGPVDSKERVSNWLGSAVDAVHPGDPDNYPALHERLHEEDLINGLTVEEMDAVIWRAGDPRSTDAARVKAAMLMFGMAGSEFWPDCWLSRR
ncbi:uncharacterized protein SCHCODRAFT_02671915 [Schizophyllum commune H4-8]|uniref:uncharacterized protein n=1 Tax=Schizophyllum commune (strain H4-8 / FGSC 9210) TaxID=578458 RepID=UPI0021602C4A|nr:uncharacterized protein SCHCODRAFT_02671915 [Schizophyllum commune H4-8]KAI5887991.1 hypothetical protein SCHCODRAFT_02671915 [Schizophyllum commune H4-8]